MRVLALADEVEDGLGYNLGSAHDIDLIVSCGDLPFDHLAAVMDRLDVPLVFVPGNHDPAVDGYRQARSGLVIRAGLPAQPPWPPGAINADGRVVDVAGLRVAGLGGSPRCRPGANQYTERQQRQRARRLAALARWKRFRDGRSVDVLLTHAPPRRVGDGDDPVHRGFECFHELAARVQPALLLHGHVHPYGMPPTAQRLDGTLVRNVVGHHVIDIELPAGRVAS